MKKILFIALLALMVLVIVPASAVDLLTIEAEVDHSGAGCVWHNGRCLAPDDYKATVGDCKVIYNPKTDVNSVYCDPAKKDDPALYAGANTCTLEGSVRAGYNTLTKEVEIRNVNQPKNESGIIIPILPDGTFRYDGLAQGDYTLKITAPAGGGADQYSKVHCTNGITRPETELLGFAATQSAPWVCQREILSAEYGAFEEQCGEPSIVHHGNYARHWHDRVCFYYGCIPGYWDYDYVGSGNGDYKKVCVRHDCRYEYAEPTSVPNCETVGGYADVTSNVKEALAQGYTSFVFSNGWLGNYEGGIFSQKGGSLISEIEDPARDVVKHVSITYKDCNGIEQHVSAEEYQQITLL